MHFRILSLGLRRDGPPPQLNQALQPLAKAAGINREPFESLKAVSLPFCGLRSTDAALRPVRYLEISFQQNSFAGSPK